MSLLEQGFAYRLIAVFAATLTTGILTMLGFSIALCFLAPSNRCFSIFRDAGFLLNAAQIWMLPAILVAIMVAMTVQYRGGLIWWNVLLFATLASIPVFVFVSWSEPPVFFLAESIVLFVGVQLARLISRLVGKFPI